MNGFGFRSISFAPLRSTYNIERSLALDKDPSISVLFPSRSQYNTANMIISTDAQNDNEAFCASAKSMYKLCDSGSRYPYKFRCSCFVARDRCARIEASVRPTHQKFPDTRKRNARDILDVCIHIRRDLRTRTGVHQATLGELSYNPKVSLFTLISCVKAEVRTSTTFAEARRGTDPRHVSKVLLSIVEAMKMV